MPYSLNIQMTGLDPREEKAIRAIAKKHDVSLARMYLAMTREVLLAGMWTPPWNRRIAMTSAADKEKA